MSSKSSSLKRLKQLARTIPDNQTIRATFTELLDDPSHNGDSILALMGTTIIERALEAAISAHFVPIPQDHMNRIFSYDFNGPLSNLSSLVRVAYALGVFGPVTHADLEKIRAIRNSFAHAAMKVTFDTPEVAAAANALVTYESITLISGGGKDKSPRHRYAETTLALASRIRSYINRVHPEDFHPIILASQRLLP